MKKASIVGAGCLFYSLATKRYLFLLRDRSKYSGTWGLPGGKIDTGESIIDGLYREIDEEMGATPAFRKVIPIETKLTYPEKAGNNLLHFLEKYKQEIGFIVSFQKPRKKGKCTKIKFLYPWELFWALKSELGKEMQYG